MRTELDSFRLTDLVEAHFGGKPPLVDDGREGIAINLHAIVVATLNCLADEGFIGLEKAE